MTQWAQYLIIFGPAVVSGALVTTRWLSSTRRPRTLRGRLGALDLDFSASWASNITVVGALLGTILSAGVLPKASPTSTATYAGLNLFFGVLILLAPLVYTATQGPVEGEHEGYVLAFLISCAITLWAVGGELATVLELFRKIHMAKSMPEAAVWIMWAAVVVAWALIMRYAWRTIEDRIDDRYETECEPQDRVVARRRSRVTLL